MPWFRVDDSFAFHSKTLMAGNEAIGLWVRAGSWSSQTLTDGFIPDHVLATLTAGSGDAAEQLLAAGLWVREEGGYRFQQWAPYQPLRADVEAAREKEAERKRTARAKGSAAGGGQKTPGAPSPVLDSLGVDAARVRQAVEREFDFAPTDTHLIRLVSHVVSNAAGEVANPTGYVVSALGKPHDHAKLLQVMKG